MVRKQNVLGKCDGDILDQIDEVDESGKEIEESSEFSDRVIEAITRLETCRLHEPKSVGILET